MKRNTIISVIFITTTILASIIAIYINVTSSNNIQQLENEISNLKNQIQSNTEVENEDKNVQNTIIKFDPTKVVNSSKEYANYFKYSVVVSSDEYYLISVENGKLKLLLVKRGNAIAKEVTINQINEKIIDVCGGNTGDGGNGFIAFLTENGNVYLSDSIYNNNKSLTLTKVDNISNICKIQFAHTFYDPAHTLMTIVAIDSNGNSYDLIYKD